MISRQGSPSWSRAWWTRASLLGVHEHGIGRRGGAGRVEGQAGLGVFGLEETGVWPPPRLAACRRSR